MTTFSYKLGDTIDNWADDDSEFITEADNIDSEYAKKLQYINIYVVKFVDILTPLHAMKIGMVLLQMLKQTPIEFRSSFEEIEASLCQYMINKIIVEDEITEVDIIQCIKKLCVHFSGRLRSSTLKDSLMEATRMNKVIDMMRMRQTVWDNLERFNQACELKPQYELFKENFLSHHTRRPAPIEPRKQKIKTKPIPDSEGWVTVSK
jgi:hypothetical protein